MSLIRMYILYNVNGMRCLSAFYVNCNEKCLDNGREHGDPAAPILKLDRLIVTYNRKWHFASQVLVNRTILCKTGIIGYNGYIHIVVD